MANYKASAKRAVTGGAKQTGTPSTQTMHRYAASSGASAPSAPGAQSMHRYAASSGASAPTIPAIPAIPTAPAVPDTPTVPSAPTLRAYSPDGRLMKLLKSVADELAAEQAAVPGIEDDPGMVDASTLLNGRVREYMRAQLNADASNATPQRTAQAVTLSDEQRALARLVTHLPGDFPYDEWDSMSTKQQLKTMSHTELSREEQWTLLNSTTSLKTLSTIQNIQFNRPFFGMSQKKADELVSELLKIDAARRANNRHENELTTPG